MAQWLDIAEGRRTLPTNEDDVASLLSGTSQSVAATHSRPPSQHRTSPLTTPPPQPRQPTFSEAVDSSRSPVLEGDDSGFVDDGTSMGESAAATGTSPALHRPPTHRSR